MQNFYCTKVNYREGGGGIMSERVSTYVVASWYDQSFSFRWKLINHLKYIYDLGKPSKEKNGNILDW